MNRRTFFSALVGAPAAAAVSKPKKLAATLYYSPVCVCGLAMQYVDPDAGREILICMNRFCSWYLVGHLAPTIALEPAFPGANRVPRS